jgi:transcriptional regulator with XRE-family HTH domain
MEDNLNPKKTKKPQPKKRQETIESPETEAFKQRLARQLREWKARNLLTNKEISAGHGLTGIYINQQTISNYMNGARSITIPTFYILARNMNIPLKEVSEALHNIAKSELGAW